MMTFYRIGEPGVACVDLESCPVLTQSAVWIDLFEPSHDEEKTVEAALGFSIAYIEDWTDFGTERSVEYGFNC